jgi:hypothetical protein
VHHTYTGVLYISYRSDKSTVLMRVGWELGIWTHQRPIFIYVDVVLSDMQTVLYVGITRGLCRYLQKQNFCHLKCAVFFTAILFLKIKIIKKGNGYVSRHTYSLIGQKISNVSIRHPLWPIKLWQMCAK